MFVIVDRSFPQTTSVAPLCLYIELRSRYRYDDVSPSRSCGTGGISMAVGRVQGKPFVPSPYVAGRDDRLVSTDWPDRAPIDLPYRALATGEEQDEHRLPVHHTPPGKQRRCYARGCGRLRRSAAVDLNPLAAVPTESRYPHVMIERRRLSDSPQIKASRHAPSLQHILLAIFRT
ncbi:hypothetical protein FKP32DRAFT_737239 [Trametes sanguinea]|nr:hypothetical protein FKP32DRAFT_737239 [Trametes sanguinea]